MTDLPHKRPCASCPYRRDVASGIWAAEEYEKLPVYDGDIGAQASAGAVRLFACHQADGHLCAGWAGHRPADELLAIRLALSLGRVNEAVLDYTTDVPLFASGAEASAHGLADNEAPGVQAVKMIGKLLRTVPSLDRS